MFKKLFIVIVLYGAIQISAASAQESPEVTEKTPVDSSLEVKDSTNTGEYYVAYYFHGDKRCMTCKKLEAFSEEALNSGFKEELKDSTLIWRPVNYDDEDNEHFIQDYGLYTKALILSKIMDGEEIAWKNLDKIWRLVGNKEEFMIYVKTETQNFMKPADK